LTTLSGPFRLAFGDRFDTLAPARKRHYDLDADQALEIEGRMAAWNRYPFLRLFIPFMPLPADDIRVVVQHRGVIDNGELCYESLRLLHYPDGIARSYTLTRPLSASPSAVFDTFNQPPNIGVTLHVELNDAGRELRQITRGPQYALFGRRRACLPGFANIHTVATERALDAQRIRTEVIVEHPLLGRMFGYHGTFTVPART
jgi:Domain of unknown function (DUF4166)